MSPVGWALLTALVWGVVPLLEKVGLGSTAPSIGVFMRSFGVAIGALLVALAVNPWAELGRMPISAMALLAGGGFLASVVGQMSFYQALKLGEVSRISPIVGTYPLVAALLGWCVLREPFTLGRLVGVVLIVGGLALLR